MRPDPDVLGPDEGDTRVITALRAVQPQDTHREQPPADLWDRIAAELPTADGPKVLRATPTVIADEPAGHTPRDTDAIAGTVGATVVSIDERRRSRWARVAAVAAALVVVGGTVVVISNDDPATQELVASVELEPLKTQGSGSAELIQVDGEPKLRITADGLPPAPEGHHYEMWLVTEDTTDARSLGNLPSGQNEVVVSVPEGVDPDAYPIVDINVQTDGQVEHSGLDTSVLRGVLA
jgi:hypothetical protein